MHLVKKAISLVTAVATISTSSIGIVLAAVVVGTSVMSCETEPGDGIDINKPVRDIKLFEITPDMTQEQFDLKLRKLYNEVIDQSSHVEAKFIAWRKTLGSGADINPHVISDMALAQGRLRTNYREGHSSSIVSHEEDIINIATFDDGLGYAQLELWQNYIECFNMVK
jgi:hypothetical protein